MDFLLLSGNGVENEFLSNIINIPYWYHNNFY